jgi:hypothetical protein
MAISGRRVWAWGPEGYFWVPGTWVRPPQVGVLWTPGYWGWGDGVYVWRAGYWGPHVGFYGGVNYGFGYGGVGYGGGRWNNGVFAYNTAVNNVNVTNIHNTYVDKTVVNNVTVNRVSYNGGAGGINARPSAQEQVAAREQHVQPTGQQIQHEQSAGTNRAQLASVNHGQPSVVATAKPGAFSGEGVVHARGAGGPTSDVRNVAASNRATTGAPTDAVHANSNTSSANSVRTNPSPHANAARPGANAAHANPSPHTNSPVANQHPDVVHQNAPRANANAQPRRTPQPNAKPQSNGERRVGGEKPKG